MSRVIILLIGLLLGGCLPQPSDSPLVEIDGERLVGRVDGGTKQTPVMSFKGIPFAAAPVGANRWRAPQPYLPRTGDRPAWDFAPACMQGEHMTRWYADVARDFGADPGGVGRFSGVSEDCLYLNVWTPDLDSSAARPVMVWVHGGSNAGGWSYEPNYLGDRLAARSVVVVTIAYRVGPFRSEQSFKNKAWTWSLCERRMSHKTWAAKLPKNLLGLSSSSKKVRS